MLTVMSRRVLSSATLAHIANMAKEYGLAFDDVLYYRDDYSPRGWSIRVNDVTKLEGVEGYTEEAHAQMPV